VTYLQPRPEDPVSVDVRRGSRVKMKAKDSVWVIERRDVTDHQTPSSNEVILCEDDGNVREGTSSNFFVIKDDGKLYTAEHGVLKGTVQILLLEAVIKHLDQPQPVVFEIPSLKDLSRWKEAFITSTSRLILPVHTLVIADNCIQFVDPLVAEKLENNVEGDGKIYHLLSNLKESPIAQNLNEKLVECMMDMSESLE
jgi:branched-subunit amino acid aminotransferase/4-amino-4-deoxychorismate lyase